MATGSSRIQIFRIKFISRIKELLNKMNNNLYSQDDAVIQQSSVRSCVCYVFISCQMHSSFKLEIYSNHKYILISQKKI